MKERGILFSAPMVRAILDGRKSQTRRIVQRQHVEETLPNGLPRTTHPGPYGVVGDRLWVRETWRPRAAKFDGVSDAAGVSIRYEEDGSETFIDDELIDYGWNMPKAAARGNVTPLFMPRWASRITLEVTGVRVERLNDISEEDAKAEGVTLGSVKATVNGAPGTAWPFSHRQAFIWLWDSINGERADWKSNPFVWVVSFRRLEPNPTAPAAKGER